MEHVWISESQCKYFLFPILRMKHDVWWLFLPVPPNSVSAPTPRPTCHVFKNNWLEKRNRDDCIQQKLGKDGISIFSYFPCHLGAGLELSSKGFHHELGYFPNLFVLVWIWRKSSDFFSNTDSGLICLLWWKKKSSASVAAFPINPTHAEPCSVLNSYLLSLYAHLYLQGSSNTALVESNYSLMLVPTTMAGLKNDEWFLCKRT